MLPVFILMMSTGITDGELFEAEPYDDERLYLEEQCNFEADVMNVVHYNNMYYFCLDYQEAAWNQTHGN